MTGPKLLPCPFCGSAAKLQKADDTISIVYGVQKWWGIVCENSIYLEGTCAVQQIPFNTKEKCIERWNFRAPPNKEATE